MEKLLLELCHVILVRKLLRPDSVSAPRPASLWSIIQTVLREIGEWIIKTRLHAWLGIFENISVPISYPPSDLAHFSLKTAGPLQTCFVQRDLFLQMCVYSLLSISALSLSNIPWFLSSFFPTPLRLFLFGYCPILKCFSPPLRT